MYATFYPQTRINDFCAYVGHQPLPPPLPTKATQQIGVAKAIDAFILEGSTSNFDCATQQHLLKFF
jgi:hypothetical protein